MASRSCPCPTARIPCALVDCLYQPASASSDASSESSSDASSDASSEASSDADASGGATVAEGGISEAGVDAGAGGQGGTPFDGARRRSLRRRGRRAAPRPLAIIPESGRAYVGLANAAYVLAFNVDENQLLVPAGGGAIPLHEGALGTNRLRLSA